MSKRLTLRDIPLGYSSEPDEYESEHVQHSVSTAEPYEIYIGNTGKVDFEDMMSLFKRFGVIEDMSLWRTHDHLYHARITYRQQDQSDRAIKEMNHWMLRAKRIRVTYAKERVNLDFKAAVRIDDIGADVTEEIIYDHFKSCGAIRFVIKTGYAAYIQFAAASSVAKAFELDLILNGDPYTLSRISANDSTDHIQVIENMKDIKCRKRFVTVENYPELPEGTPVCRYKSQFESVGTVLHFKIAPTDDGTVTLSLCMAKPEERDMVIDRFNGTVISDKRLKVYVAQGRPQMETSHFNKYFVDENSIRVFAVRPYCTDYDVCMLFRKCGSICFVEQYDREWRICFDNPSAVFLARNNYVFCMHDKRIKIKAMTSSKPAAPSLKDIEKTAHNKPDQKNPENCIKQVTSRVDETIKQELSHVTTVTSLEAATIAANQPKQTDAFFKSRESPTEIEPFPVQGSAPSSSQSKKHPGLDIKSETQQACDRQNSTNDSNSSMKKPNPNPSYNIAITNLPKNIVENDLREMFPKIEMPSVSLFCTKDLYHPTSVAYVKLTSSEDTKAVMQRHLDMYRGKRVIIERVGKSWALSPEHTVMLKYLPKNMTEEVILEELEKRAFNVTHVIRPTHHYAYVKFAGDLPVNDAMFSALRNGLTQFKIDVFPLYHKMPKRWVNHGSFDNKPIETVRASYGLVLKDDAKDADGEFGVHNAHKLFVGNIPRDTQAEDVIDYFNNFGSIIDYAPSKERSCYLRKSFILSFVDAKHAQNAFCQQPHFLEGSMLDVHLMDSPPAQFSEEIIHSRLLTVKSHSRFLTTDEIRNTVQRFVDVVYHIRFDAFDHRANFYANCKLVKLSRVSQLLHLKYINDEAVKFVLGYDPAPPTEDEAREKLRISSSPHRQGKEKYLSFAVDKEILKTGMEVCTRPNNETDLPFKSFHNSNSVQINNVSLHTSLEDLRDLFVKCGDIVDYRAMLLKEDDTKICFVKFNTDLAAELACTYSQRMVNEKRILVHLANETPLVERDRSVLVERLNPATSTEQIHDQFTTIGTVKYVQKHSPHSAIVCFRDTDCMLEVVNVTAIPNSESSIISPCRMEYDPRFFIKFSYQEDHIPIERMRAALKPRILPAFHQLELNRQVFETLPEDIKTPLFNEVFLAREQIPDFNQLSKLQQINALKTQYQDFTQKEHFLRLTAREKEKLLDMTHNQQQDYTYEQVKVQEVLPPASKRARNEEPVTDLSGEPEHVEPPPDSHSPALSNLQKIESLATAPMSGLVGFRGNDGPRSQIRPNWSNVSLHEGEEGAGSQQRFPQFAEGMPPSGTPNRPRMMQPGPRPIMRAPPTGGISSADARSMHQRIAEMAYNVCPRPRYPMSFGRINRPT